MGKLIAVILLVAGAVTAYAGFDSGNVFMFLGGSIATILGVCGLKA